MHQIRRLLKRPRSDSRTLSIPGSVDVWDSDFSGTVSYSDNASGTYNDSDHGSDTDEGDNIDETDAFNDSDGGHENISQSIQGSVDDGYFSGTIGYSDNVSDDYHASDGGNVGSHPGASATGADHFDVGDSGTDHPSISVDGAFSGGGTLSYSNDVNDTYDEDDTGDDSEATGSAESESDVLITHDNATASESLHQTSPTIDGTTTIDDDSSNGTIKVAGNDAESTTAGTDDSKITADDQGNSRAARTTIQAWGGYSCTSTDTTWGNDKDHHTYGRHVRAAGDEISRPTTAGGTTRSGHRYDYAGDYERARHPRRELDYNQETHDNHTGVEAAEATLYRHTC